MACREMHAAKEECSERASCLEAEQRAARQREREASTVWRPLKFSLARIQTASLALNPFPLLYSFSCTANESELNLQASTPIRSLQMIHGVQLEERVRAAESRAAAVRTAASQAEHSSRAHEAAAAKLRERLAAKVKLEERRLQRDAHAHSRIKHALAAHRGQGWCP